MIDADIAMSEVITGKGSARVSTPALLPPTPAARGETSPQRVREEGLWCRGRRVQTGDKRRVLRAGQPALDDGEHRRQIAPQERCRVEPQTREDLALEESFRVYRHARVLPGAQHEPVKFLLQHTPDDILAHPIAAIDTQLDMQVIARRT